MVRSRYPDLDLDQDPALACELSSLCGQSPGLMLKIQVENFWPVFPSLWGFCVVPKECLQLECCHLYTDIKIK